MLIALTMLHNILCKNLFPNMADLGGEAGALPHVHCSVTFSCSNARKHLKRLSRNNISVARQMALCGPLWHSVVPSRGQSYGLFPLPTQHYGPEQPRITMYWATRLSVCFFACTTHQFTCSTLPTLSCAHSVTRSFTYSRLCWKVSNSMLGFEAVLAHSAQDHFLLRHFSFVFSASLYLLREKG